MDAYVDETGSVDGLQTVPREATLAADVGGILLLTCDGNGYQPSHTLVAAVIDLSMPGTDGVDVFDGLVALRPSLPVILSSGYGDGEIAHRLRDRQVRHFVQKTYSLAQLRTALVRATEGDDSERAVRLRNTPQSPAR